MNFSDFTIFPVLVIFIFKLDANFPGLWQESAYSVGFLGFIHQKNKLISAISWELDDLNRKKYADFGCK